ncbi:MAG: hypothetical protein NZM18_09740 [Thermoflexales bacterium]|nr:hypothetical protein [Thermoflexales bacterium]MDW8352213.1 hypothetical protein [Anaerolineae bacterium]
MRRWRNLTSPKTIFSISQHGASSAWLLGTNEGLWRYAGGEACEQIAEPLKNTLLTAVAAHNGTPAQNGLIIVGANDGIAYSGDGGASWTAGALREPAQIAFIVLSPAFDQDGVAFAATTGHGVLRSTDGGRSWVYRNFGLPDYEVTAIALSPMFPADGMLFVAVTGGLFYSINRGESWRLSPVPSEALPLSGIAFARNALIVGSESRGLYHSANRGTSWSKRSAFSSGPISALAVSPDGTKIAVATPMVVALSSDFGETWERTEGRMPRDPLSLWVDNDGTILCGTQQNGLWIYA